MTRSLAIVDSSSVRNVLFWQVPNQRRRQIGFQLSLPDTRQRGSTVGWSSEKGKAPGTELRGTNNDPEGDLLRALSAGEVIDLRNTTLLTWLLAGPSVCALFRDVAVAIRRRRKGIVMVFVNQW